jgi:hypothetical protein
MSYVHTKPQPGSTTYIAIQNELIGTNTVSEDLAVIKLLIPHLIKTYFKSFTLGSNSNLPKSIFDGNL